MRNTMILRHEDGKRYLYSCEECNIYSVSNSAEEIFMHSYESIKEAEEDGWVEDKVKFINKKRWVCPECVKKIRTEYRKSK